MKIDAWAHMLPKPCLDRLGAQSGGAAGRMVRFLAANPALYDLDLRFRTMDRFSEYVQVLTPTPLSQIAASSSALRPRCRWPIPAWPSPRSTG